MNKFYASLFAFSFVISSSPLLPVYSKQSLPLSSFMVRSIEPITAEDYFYRGKAFYDNENYEKAIADFNKVLTIEEDIAIYYYRGFSYLYLNQYQKALADANRGLQLDSNDPDFYSLRGIVYYALDRNVDAISDLQKAIILYEQSGNQEFTLLLKEIVGKIRAEIQE